MRRKFLSEAQKYIKKNRNHRVWRNVVIALACVVVFCTTYALILPAITTEKDTLEGVVGDAMYQEALSDTSSDDTTGTDGNTTEGDATNSENSENNEEGRTNKDSGQTTTLTLGNGEIDFEQYIKEITVQHKQQYDSNWKDVEADTVVKRDDLLRFNIEYVLPGGTLSYENPSIIYELPNSIKSVEADSGKVYSDGGEEIGTYTISEDGKIKITFYESYVKKNSEGQQIDGYIKFDSSVDKIEKTEEGKIELPYKENQKVVIQVEKEKTGDVKVEKKASEVQNGKVTYTITVSSEKGTSDKVALKDIMNNVVYNSGFKVTDKNGNEVTNIQAPSADSTQFNIELPKMNAGDKYTITYTAEFNEISNQTIYGKNNVTVTSKDSNDNELKDESSVTSTFNNKIIEKSGKLSEDKSEITWTIVVNESKQDISGYTIKDDKYEGKATLTSESGESSEITLPYTFPNGSNNKYTITYKTSSDRALEGTTVKNTATIGKEPDKEVSSGSSIWVDGFNPLSKKAENLAISQDGTTADITWNVLIKTDEGDIPAGWVFTESLQGDQWFTEAQQTEIANIFTGLNSKYPNKIEWTTRNINGENKVAGFKVTFTNKLEKGQDPIEITYHSTGYLGDGSSSITFRNGVNINNKVWSNGEISYKAVPVVTKYDLNGNSTNDTSYNYDNVTNGILRWGFKVTIPKKADGQSIVITEKLPEGVTLLENEGLKIIDGNTSYAVTFTEGNGTVTINNQAINITKNADNTITIEIPEELTVGGDELKEYKFEVQVKIDDDYDWEKKTYSYVGTFKNEVIVKDKDDNELGKDDQTQTVTKNYTESDNVLKKTHESATNGSAYENNIIPYSIVVNKNGDDLLEGSDKLTLKDVLENTYSNNDPVNISLVPGSLHVYKLNADGTKGDELSTDQMKYTFVVDSVKPYDGATKKTYTLSIELPDEQALIVEYKYKVDARTGYWLNINNIASLEGTIEDSYISKDFTTINIIESSAGANIRGVTIYKVDSDNNAIRLTNAEFELYRWDSQTGKYVMVKASDTSDTFVTDSDGNFSIKKLAYNTAYKLVEVKAPDGYIKSKKPHYFIIGNSDTENNPISKPDDFDGIEYPGGSVIYIANKMNSTSITVNKKWFDTEGNDVTGTTGGEITFDLWQKSSTTKPGESDGGSDNPSADIGKIYSTTPYVINHNNNWTITIDGLPTEGTNEDGETVYYTYYVQEKQFSNCTTEYENNEGITSGTITIKNTKTENPTYVLPETGKFGGNLMFILGGVLLTAGSLVYIYRRKYKKGDVK